MKERGSSVTARDGDGKTLRFRLKDGRRATRAGMQAARRNRKGQGNRFSSGAPRGEHCLAENLVLAQGDPSRI